jgi:hypothetical protein
LYIYTDENFCAVGRPLHVASLDRNTRRSIGDCGLVGRNSETAIIAGWTCQISLDHDWTLLRAGDSSGWFCGLFQLWPTQGQSSFLGVDSADCIFSDQDNAVDTIQCSGRPQLAHNVGALLRRNASAVPRREYHHTVLHRSVVYVRCASGRRQCVSLPASACGCWRLELDFCVA